MFRSRGLWEIREYDAAKLAAKVRLSPLPSFPLLVANQDLNHLTGGLDQGPMAVNVSHDIDHAREEHSLATMQLAQALN
jgi:hypothetical protein